jgi:signal transduction histidine kinase
MIHNPSLRHLCEVTSRDRAFLGGGLGLAIVNAIARAHGGSLKLSAAEGGGAMAQIILPIDGKDQD